ncbi:MAG: ankyrin repeat domain-containing protein [Alphaproteobacteria bacterium]
MYSDFGFRDDFDRNTYRKKTPEEIEADKKAARDKATQELLKEMDCGGGRHPRAYMVSALLKEGADAEATTEYWNRTPMSIAAGYNDIAVVRELVKGGAKYDSPDVYHHTPFQVASGYGYLDLMKYLMELDVDIHRPDENGETPLIRAVVPGCRLEAVKILIAAGARLEDADNAGKTVFDHCRERKDMHGNYGGTFDFVERRSKGGRSSRDVYTEMERLLLDIWHEKFIKDGRPTLAPEWAAKILNAALAQGDAVIAADVLAAGAGVNAPDAKGWTPLMWATSRGDVALMEALVERGADINAQDAAGSTALMKAVSPYRGAAVMCLIDSNAYVDIRDVNGKNALDHAGDSIRGQEKVEDRPSAEVYEEFKKTFDETLKRQEIEQYRSGLRKAGTTMAKLRLKPPGG